MDFIPTGEILDKLAQQIGQVFFQLGAALGLSIATLKNIQSYNTRDLVAQNREVLFTWRNDETVKPSLMVLMQALSDIGRGVPCLEEILKNVHINTLVAAQAVRDEPDKGSQKKTERTGQKGMLKIHVK